MVSNNVPISFIIYIPHKHLFSFDTLRYMFIVHNLSNQNNHFVANAHVSRTKKKTLTCIFIRVLSEGNTPT